MTRYGKADLPVISRAAVIISFLLLAIIVALFVYFGHFSYRGTLIHTGALFGTIMAFNVWFRIWPASRQIIRAVKGRITLPAQTPIVKLAGLRSRHNTYMSVPLLWAMIGQHTTFFAGGNLGIPNNLYWVVWLVIIIIGWHIVFQCLQEGGQGSGILKASCPGSDGRSGCCAWPTFRSSCRPLRRVQEVLAATCPATTSGARSVNSSFVSEGMLSFSPFVMT